MALVSLISITGASWVWNRRCFQQSGDEKKVTLKRNGGFIVVFKVNMLNDSSSTVPSVPNSN